MERLSIDEVIAHCNRKVDFWEKVFTRENLENSDFNDIHNRDKEYWEHRQVSEWLEELKSYRDAEEQGLLLRLPCRPNEIVYVAEKGYKTRKALYACQSAILDDVEHGLAIGYTKEEAEAALEQMKGAESALYEQKN